MSVVTVIAPDLDAYRAEVERFLDESASITDDRFRDLFSAAAVEGIESVAASGVPRRMRSLARFAAEGYIRASSANESAEIEEIIRLPIVGGGDGAVALLDVDGLLAAEPDRERRRDLQRARLRTIDAHLARLIGEARLRRDDAARAVQAPRATALLARVAGIPLGIVAADGMRILDATDDVAARAMDRASRDALGLALGDATAADLPRLVRAPQLENEMVPDGAAAAVERTCELLGLSESAGVGGSSHAGLVGYAETLRTAGIALAHNGASNRLPIEARRLGRPRPAACPRLPVRGPAHRTGVADARARRARRRPDRAGRAHRPPAGCARRRGTRRGPR